MSRLPTFAQGVQFCVDTTPDSLPQPERFPQGGQRDYRPRFAPRGFAGGPGNFRGPPRSVNTRGFRNFAPRQAFGHGHGYGQSQGQGPGPGQGQGQARGPRQWAPRRPNFSNPYEKQLTPREYTPRQQRWHHSTRGGRAPLSTEFGPCASGATAETLAIIDAFVKPSMLEDPWKSLESTRCASSPKKAKFQSEESSGQHRLPSTSTSREDSAQNTSYSDNNDDNDDGGGGDEDDEEHEFNLKDFIPKV